MLCLLPRIKEYPKDTFPSGLSKHFFNVNMLLSGLGHTAKNAGLEPLPRVPS